MLKPPIGTDYNLTVRTGAPPICIAIVCEWCDKGCLGAALYKRTFPHVLPAGAQSLLNPGRPSGLSPNIGTSSSYGNLASPGIASSRHARQLDFKVRSGKFILASSARVRSMVYEVHRVCRPLTWRLMDSQELLFTSCPGNVGICLSNICRSRANMSMGLHVCVRMRQRHQLLGEGWWQVSCSWYTCTRSLEALPHGPLACH